MVKTGEIIQIVLTSLMTFFQAYFIIKSAIQYNRFNYKKCKEIENCQNQKIDLNID